MTENTILMAYQSAMNLGLIDDCDTVVIFLDFSIIDNRLQRLKEAFPKDTLHAVAIKTNPLTAVLRHIVKSGLGLEAASFGEIKLADNVGIEPARLVFDSPAKTAEEIQHLTKYMPGMRINANSLDELEHYPKSGARFRLGLRINPLVNPHSVDSMNVGTKVSKFGILITESSNIVQACIEWEDIDSLHLHVGSQYIDLGPTVMAVRKVIDLAKTVNTQAGYQKIRSINIGGGFPVNYHDNVAYLIEDYAAALRGSCEELFDGTYKLITEFGRYIHANACWAISKIEYVKNKSDGVTLITHAGADMFLRECYNPQDWRLRISVMSDNGVIKRGNNVSTNVAGPLCFGGDYLGKGIELPKAAPGDCLVLHDIGANTFALWSRHCSRPFPKVISLNSVRDVADVEVAKERESFDSIIDFWS